MICFFFIQVIAWMLPSKRNFHGPCHYWQHKLAANSYLIIFLLIFWKLLFSHSCVGLFMTPWPSACQASVLHCLPEFAQTYVHWVDDAIQPSHPLSLDVMILVFWMLSFKPAFFTVLFHFLSRGSLVLFRFLPLGMSEKTLIGLN